MHAYSLILITLITLGQSVPAAAFEAGIGVTAETTGFPFSPKLKSLTIVEIKSGLPAEQAGVRVGDRIIAINDCKIPGCPAKEAKAMTKKAPLTLTLLSTEGEVRQAVLQANKQ